MATDRTDVNKTNAPDRNPDPITGAPGSHPTGVGIGSASGAATGAAIGALGGPIGAAIGIIAGGIVGGYVGKGVGETVDPTEDVNYWRNEYKNRPYYSKDHDYDRDLAPAYRYGSVAGMGVGDDYDRPLNTTGSMAGTAAATGSAASTTGGSRADDDSMASTAGSMRGRSFDDHENDFRAGWDKVKGTSSLSYDHARDAIRDAFDRKTKSGGQSTTNSSGR